MSSRCSLGVISGRWDLWPIHLDMQRGAGDILVLPSGRTSLLALEMVRATAIKSRTPPEQDQMRSKEWRVFLMDCTFKSLCSITLILNANPACKEYFVFVNVFVEIQIAVPLIVFFTCRHTDQAMWCLPTLILCLFNEILHTPAAIWLSSGQTYALLSHHAVLRMSSGDVEHI